MGNLSYIFCLLLALVSGISAIELLAEPENGPVIYEFEWSVNDPHTGDIKSQKESRKDDKVEGVYALIDPDGFRRIVQYSANDHSGFQAIVQREPTDIKIPLPESPKKLLAAKILSPVLPVAPLVHYASAPKAILKQDLGVGNYVSVSRPTAQYKY